MKATHVIVGHIQGYVFNGRRSDADYDCGAMGISIITIVVKVMQQYTTHLWRLHAVLIAEGIGKIGLNVGGSRTFK